MGVRELNRTAPAVVASIRDGERMILTRHGNPQGIIFSVRDAIELALAPSLERFAIAAEEDYQQGDVLKLWPERLPSEVLLARRAASDFEVMHTGHRGVVRRVLRAMDPWNARPLWSPDGHLLIPFSMPAEAVVLVHAVVDAWSVERALIGEGLHRARQARDAVRGLRRGEWPPPRAGGQGGVRDELPRR